MVLGTYESQFFFFFLKFIEVRTLTMSFLLNRFLMYVMVLLRIGAVLHGGSLECIHLA